MSKNPERMTESQAGRIIVRQMAAFIVMSIARLVLPPRYDFVILLLAVGFIVLLYRAVPAGRSMDFNVGMLTGGMLSILAYEAMRVATPMLMDFLTDFLLR